MKLEMHFEEFTKLQRREILAEHISAIIQVGYNRSFKPKRVDENGLSWTLDASRSWWRLNFTDGNNTVFEIKNKHNHPEKDAEKALAGWLCYDINAKIVE